MANGIPDSWKKDYEYGNNVFTLNINQKTLPVESTLFSFFNVLYFSLIRQNLEENSSLNISFVSFRYIGLILCDYLYNVQCIQ